MRLGNAGRTVIVAALLLASPAWGASVGAAVEELAAAAEGAGEILRAAELLRAAVGLPSIVRVSVASDGTEADNDSFPTAPCSADGKLVAFYSCASNLVPPYPGGGCQVFLHDAESGATERVSVASDGTPANSASSFPAMSSEGRFVAFNSSATNLVPDDANGATDVFVRDRDLSATERVSVASDGTEGNGPSGGQSISADGRFVAFTSYADNLVPDDTNGAFDDFVHDRTTGITERVSVASDGTEGNADSEWVAISADGRFVVFNSRADNLVPDDANGVRDAFVHDRTTGITERVSVASDGTENDADVLEEVSISGDGRIVLFATRGTTLVPSGTPGVRHVYARDRDSGVTERISVDTGGNPGNNDSQAQTVSYDGRFVAFSSLADNLIPNDTNGEPPPTFVGLDLFVRDRWTARTVVASVNALGVQGDGESGAVNPNGISADGRFVSLISSAPNLVLGKVAKPPLLNRFWFDVFLAPNPLAW